MSTWVPQSLIKCPAVLVLKLSIRHRQGAKTIETLVAPAKCVQSNVLAVNYIGIEADREREGGMQINTRIYYMRIISLMRLRSSMRMIGAACKLLSCQCSGQGPKMGWGIITPNFMAMLKGKMTFHARGLGSFTILTHLNCHSNDNGEITFRYSVINTPR